MTHQPTVLLVEDEPVLRLTFEGFLTEEGFRVVACATFEDALGRLDTEAVDIVVSDIVLGRATGMDLLREIERRCLGCEVIMMTGDPRLDSAAEAVRLGAFDYLIKPVSETDLKRVCRLALNRHRLAAERDAYRSELEAIFNSVPAGILSLDADLKLHRANPPACEWFGLPSESHDTGLDALSVSDCSTLRKAGEAAIRSGTTTTDVTLEIPSQNGQRARMLVANVVPLTRSDRAERGAAVVIRDITRLIYLEDQVGRQQRFHQLIGGSAAMREIYRLIEDLSHADSTVLICGESGTGKELIAEAVHQSSERAGKPLVRVNCSALAEELLESELFGHVRGAFTGAVKDRVGRFEAANGGTLFLDEIGDISPRLQLRLLRVLQQGEFERVGDSRTIRVDVRIIAATNQDLTARMEAGQFREDLYYRLNVIRVDVPPLRDRIGDLPLIAEHFVRHFNAKFHKEIAGISADTLTLLMNHRWKGNVRELENCVERAFIVCHGPIIQPEQLPKGVLSSSPGAWVPRSVESEAAENKPIDRSTLVSVLATTDWNVAKAARRLGIARNTVYEKMKRFAIQRPSS